MKDLTHPRIVFPLRNLFVTFVTVLGFLTILGIILTQQAQAGFSCVGTKWSVANETELNSAISCYNAKTTAGDYTISFTQNISLTNITTAINNTSSNVTLVVDGEGFIIDGQGIEGVRPFTINSTTHVTIQNGAIIRGNSLTSGGGMLNNGILTVTNSTLSNNSAFTGGGIYNQGILTISYSKINNNSANSGGGIYSGFKGLGNGTVSNTTISENSADQKGGGIYNDAHLIVSNSTLSDNSAATEGGGIYNYNTLNVGNSTISGNSAITSGGGIRNHIAHATISNSTLSDNSATTGGGIYNTGINVVLDNSIIANSRLGVDCISSNAITDNGYNIIEDNSCNFTDGSDPMLGSLQNNGGPTFTHALLPGSPAIDSGNTILTYDQRGWPRPVGSADDIGAFEGFDISDFLYLPMVQKQ